MTEQSPVSIDEVRELVAERHRFDEWLAALQARRDATPEHVYLRVHGDYVARREQVMVSLHEHVPGLEQHLAELDTRATDLRTRSQAQEDERAEAMLRHAVGEYDDATWDEVRTRVEESLATLGTEHGSLEAQRDDVRSLLQSARPAVAADAQHPDEWGGFTPPPVPATEGADSATPDWLGAVTPASVPTQSPTDPVDTAGVVDGIELTPDAPAQPPASQGAGLERPSIWGSRESGVPGSVPESAETHESLDVFGNATSQGTAANGLASDARESQGASGGAAPAGAFDELAFLRSVIDPQSNSAPAAPRAPGTGDAQKTLRCTECGTMNLPTEWYCERCGGELAAF